MKLLVGVCTRGADIHYKTYEFMAYTVFSTPGAKMVMVHSPYSASDGQEKLFQLFAKSDYTHLLVVDSDVVPDMDAAAKLLAHDKEIVVAPVWYYDDGSDTLAYGAYHKWADNKGEEDKVRQRVPKSKGFEKIVSAGFGCMLVRKDVTKIFKDAKDTFTSWTKSLPEHMKVRTSDNIFWAKCTNYGIEAYIDWSIGTIHYKTIGISNKLIDDLRRAKK